MGFQGLSRLQKMDTFFNDFQGRVATLDRALCFFQSSATIGWMAERASGQLKTEPTSLGSLSTL